MKELGFRTLEELYNRLKPALITKCHELERNNINGITEKDIWEYLRDNFWKNRSDLTLDEMVDDILNVSNDKLIIFHNNHEINNQTNNNLL